MKIDNVTVTSERGIITATSNIHGYTFTHGENCGILHTAEHATISDHPFRWGDKCDCFLSRVEITEVNGVPVAALPKRPWWKPSWSLASFTAGVVVSSLWDWLVPYA